MEAFRMSEQQVILSSYGGFNIQYLISAGRTYGSKQQVDSITVGSTKSPVLWQTAYVVTSLGLKKLKT